MKIYNPKPIPLVRLQIKRYKENTKYITLCETTRKEVIDFIKSIVKNKIDPFSKGNKTSIYIKYALGSQNLKSETVSFYGLKTEEVYNLILKHINNE